MEIRKMQMEEVSIMLEGKRLAMSAAKFCGLHEKYVVLLREYAELLGMWEEVSR